MELGLTIPLQRHLGVKALPYGEGPDRRFCWDLHVISLRGRSSLLAVHCHSRYTFVFYDLNPLDWAHLPDIFREGLERSLGRPRTYPLVDFLKSMVLQKVFMFFANTTI